MNRILVEIDGADGDEINVYVDDPLHSQLQVLKLDWRCPGVKSTSEVPWSQLGFCVIPLRRAFKEMRRRWGKYRLCGANCPGHKHIVCLLKHNHIGRHLGLSLGSRVNSSTLRWLGEKVDVRKSKEIDFGHR